MSVAIELGVIVTRQDEGQEEDLRVEIEAKVQKLQGFGDKRVSGYLLKRAPVQVLKFVFNEMPLVDPADFPDILEQLLTSRYQITFTTTEVSTPAMDWCIRDPEQ